MSYNARAVNSGTLMTQTNIVTRNLGIDTKEINSRKRENDPRYPKGVVFDETITACLQGELVLLIKENQDHPERGDISGLEGYGLTTLNGISGRSETYDVFINRFMFGGFTIIEANASDMFPRTDFTATIGGTTTTKNTGSETITVGDFVMWDLPEYYNPLSMSDASAQPYYASTSGFGFSGKSATRILPILRKFDPRDCVSSSLDYMYDYLTTPNKDDGRYAKQKDTKLRAAANALNTALRASFVNAFLGMARMAVSFEPAGGNVAPVEHFLINPEVINRLLTGQKFMDAISFNTGLDINQAFVVNISDLFGLTLEPGRPEKHTARVGNFGTGRLGAVIPPQQTTTNVSVADFPAILTFKKHQSIRAYSINETDEFAVYGTALSENISNYLTTAVELDRFHRDRIVGRALNTAPAGHSLDLILGAIC